MLISGCDDMALLSLRSHFRPRLLSDPDAIVELYREAPGTMQAGNDPRERERRMQQRTQAAVLGAALTVLILALFLVAAHWQGVLPGFGTF